MALAEVLKGELLLATDPASTADAEALFHHRALDIARARRRSPLELRAATSLARLWRDQGKRAEARELLAPIHDWFTEGFDRRLGLYVAVRERSTSATKRAAQLVIVYGFDGRGFPPRDHAPFARLHADRPRGIQPEERRPPPRPLSHTVSAS